jgi:DNA repair photolyase
MARAIPGVAAPSLAARLEPEAFRERAGVSYRRLHARSLVNRCDSPNVPFDWTANPYRGCAMGCRYCYAAYTHEFVGLEATADFHTTVLAKVGGEAETLRALRRAAQRGELVALGTATDPYQPGEAELRVTRRLLELAAGVRGLRLALTTKGALVLRDLDLLARLHARGRLSVAVSLVSLRADLLRRLEPWAPAPTARLEVLRRLAAAGFDAALSLAPVLPGLTDSEADLDALLGAARAAGVSRVFWRLLFLRSPTREALLDFLRREFANLAPAYERAYGRAAHLRGRYPDALRRHIERLATRHGVSLGAGRGALAQVLPQQQRLWT